MSTTFPEDERSLREAMRALGQQVLALPKDARFGGLAEAGLFRFCLPTAIGGLGRSFVDTASAFEALGETLADGGLLLATGAHLFGVACTIASSASEELMDEVLADLASGKRIGTVGATEIAAGSDVASTETELAAAGDAFALSGDKRYVTYAARATDVLVLARHERGLCTVLAERDASVRPGAPYALAGLATSELAPVRFAATPVPPHRILGRIGAGMAVFQQSMTFERGLILAFRVGAMQAELEASVRFARKRKVGGTPIAKHQAVAHRIARMRRLVERSRLSLRRAAEALDEGRRAHEFSALAKWEISESAVELAHESFLLRGGQGLLEDEGSVQRLTDALGGTIHSGTPDVLANIVARWTGV